MDDTEMSLVCWIVGLDNAFTVDLPRSKTVGHLKNAIMKMNGNTLHHVDAAQLEIWKLKNPLSVPEIVETLEIIGAGDVPDADKLDHLKKLSYYFPQDPVEEKVHLVVRLPYIAETNEDEGSPPKRLKERHTKLQTPEYTQLADFHRRYWGKPLDPAFTTLPQDPDDELDGVLPGDPFLDGMTKRYLVRAEYIRAFDKVKALYDASRSSHLAVITGQPGIGKTLWIDYALRRCFGEKQPVILYRWGQFLYFSDTVVAMGLDPRIRHHPEYTWCFVDSDQLPEVVYDPLSALFPIYVTPPQDQCWEQLHQLREPKLIIMNPWTWDELEKALVLYPDRTSEDLWERFDKAGPTPRYCLESTAGYLNALYSERDALFKRNAVQSMMPVLFDSAKLSIDISRPLCLVRRPDSEDVQPILESDTYVIEPISSFMKKRFYSQLCVPELDFLLRRVLT